MKKNTMPAVVAMSCSVSVLAGYAQTVFGQSSIQPLMNSSSTLSSLINNILGIFNLLVPLLIGAAVVVFLYGVLIFIAKASAGDAAGRKDGINFMIFGIIGIAVMVSVWGLVAFVTVTLGTDGVVPQFNPYGL